MSENQVDKVLQFWFKGITDEQGEAPKTMWFRKSEETDNAIREQFSELYNKAKNKELASWEDSPSSLLALIIVLDQFSRNLLRNSGEAFAQDQECQRLAFKAIESKIDEQLQLIYRLFIYMPLMHSEQISHHEIALIKFGQLVELSQTKAPQHTKVFEGIQRCENSHLKIIQQFGRYPHRNKDLGRQTTPEEEEFLKTFTGF